MKNISWTAIAVLCGLLFHAARSYGQATNITFGGSGQAGSDAPSNVTFTWPATSCVNGSNNCGISASSTATAIMLGADCSKGQTGPVGAMATVAFDLAVAAPYTLSASASYNFTLTSGCALVLDSTSYNGAYPFLAPFNGVAASGDPFTGGTLSGVLAAGHHTMSFSAGEGTGLGVYAVGGVTLQFLPEPASLCLLGVGGLALLRRRGAAR